MYCHVLEIETEKLNVSIAKNNKFNPACVNYKQFIFNEGMYFFQKCMSEVSDVCMFLQISSSWLSRGQRIVISVGVFNLSHRLGRKVSHHTVALSPVQVTVGLL